MRLLISSAALLLSITLLQLSSGAIAPLDALSGLQLGFSKTQIGLFGSAQFLGFFIGCWWAPRLLGMVGHARSFAVFAACGAIGAATHPLIHDPAVWTVLRGMTGFCVAGCYTVIESWMQATATNETRGRLMGAYRVVDIVSSSAAQLLIGVLDPVSYVSYNLLAILCCATLFPLMLTRLPQPKTPPMPRLRPIRTAMISPLGTAGVVVAGITSSAFRMVGPLYAQDVGLSAEQLGYFMATVFLGGAAAQYPVGWLADKYDRRWVLIWLSAASVAACLLVIITSGMHIALMFINAALFGVATYPIFSVSTAHTNDFTEQIDAVEVNASLMFIYAIGAIFSPLISSALIQFYGPSALFALIAFAHVALVVFGAARMRKRKTVERRIHYTVIPRTSFIIDKVMKISRRRFKS